jgi:hypothetical protein
MKPIFTDTIAFNSFVSRQTEDSPYTHWTISEYDFLERIYNSINAKTFSQGYREGVIVLHLNEVNPEEFWTGQVVLEEGDCLVGTYKARAPGEEPRKTLNVLRDEGKQSAKAVDVILYHHDVLLENKENDTDCDWEIVSVNARPTLEPEPIDPETLMHNHFGSSGGTATNMTAEEFEVQMKESFLYWKDKAFLR